MNAPTTINLAPLYISPVFQRLVSPRPDPLPACATCPASMWYVSSHPDGQQLRCFCSRLHVTTWDPSLEPILQCDGREVAMMAIEQERSEKAERKAEKEERRTEREAQKRERKADRKVSSKEEEGSIESPSGMSTTTISAASPIS